jgi:hypothetical protein
MDLGLKKVKSKNLTHKLRNEHEASKEVNSEQVMHAMHASCMPACI